MHPFLARTFFRIHEGLLQRPTFARLAELRKSQWLPREQMEQLRLERLRELLTIAYEHTSYWRTVMDERGVAPGEVDSLDVLRKFPFLMKETMRGRREDMVWKEQGPRVGLVRTSGSTNEALQFYTSSFRESQITAARMRGHEWAGIRKGDKEMYFWGSPVELSKQDHVKHLRDFLVNDGLTNGFELTSERTPQYIDTWMRWRPKVIFGYPSSFTLLIQMASKQGLRVSGLKDRGLRSICTTSEILTDVDRQTIEEAFGVPVFDSYGLREAGLVGYECDQRTMHTMDEHQILETIDPVTAEPTDGEGELVITSLISHPMPVIRYRTGDVVRISQEPCACGRSLGRIEISGGRVADFVITNEGKWVVGYSFIYICRSIKGVAKFQVYQDKVGEIVMRVVVDENFPSDGDEQIKTAVSKRLGGENDIIVEHLDDIAPAPSGKYRPVIGKVADRMRQEGQMSLS